MSILQNHRVVDLVEQNEHAKEGIERAAIFLENEPNPIAAIYEAARAHIEGKINVFFSYKSQDEETAKVIVNKLRLYAAGKLEIVYAGEFAKTIAGANWNDKIRESIKKAHWFILLLPDPSVDWDWCLFETGIFRGKMVSDKVNKLFCLHHPDQPDLPPQIKEFQAIKAETKTVEGFLENIYLDSGVMPGMEPINPHFKSEIPEIAKEIVDAIEPPTHGQDFSFHPKNVTIKISIPHDEDENIQREKLDNFLKEAKDLNAAKIVKIDELALDIFGKNSQPATWGDLIERVCEKYPDQEWLNELCNSIRATLKGDIYVSFKFSLKGFEGDKMWFPLLLGSNRTTKRVIVSFVIGFIERTHIPIMNIDQARALCFLGIDRDLYKLYYRLCQRIDTKDEKNKQTISFCVRDCVFDTNQTWECFRSPFPNFINIRELYGIYKTNGEILQKELEEMEKKFTDKEELKREIWDKFLENTQNMKEEFLEYKKQLENNEEIKPVYLNQ